MVKAPLGSVLRKASAISFLGLIIALVIIANLGEGGRIWGWLHNIPYADKVGHLLLFGTLSFLFNFAFSKRGVRKLIPPFTTVTVILLAVVSLEEFTQKFISTRSFDLRDWFADLLGIFLGQVLALSLLKKPALDAKTGGQTD